MQAQHSVNEKLNVRAGDGLGRLLCEETPIQSSGLTCLQRKEMFYDGVRRIQELIDRPDLIPQCTTASAPSGDGNDD